MKLESEIQNAIMTRYFYYQLINIYVTVGLNGMQVKRKCMTTHICSYIAFYTFSHVSTLRRVISNDPHSHSHCHLIELI